MTNPETSKNFETTPEHLSGAEQGAGNIRGITLFDENLHVDVGRYRPQTDFADGEEAILVVESFNARLKHLGDKVATFTRQITPKEYGERRALYRENPVRYLDIQIANLKR